MIGKIRLYGSETAKAVKDVLRKRVEELFPDCLDVGSCVNVSLFVYSQMFTKEVIARITVQCIAPDFRTRTFKVKFEGEIVENVSTFSAFNDKTMTATFDEKKAKRAVEEAHEAYLAYEAKRAQEHAHMLMLPKLPKGLNLRSKDGKTYCGSLYLEIDSINLEQAEELACLVKLIADKAYVKSEN